MQSHISQLNIVSPVASTTNYKKSNQNIRKKETTHDSVRSTSSKSRKSSMRTEISKIENAVNALLGTDNHPFVKDSYPENGELYCTGNKVLTSLNLSCKS